MKHAYFAPALQYFGSPERARAYRYDDDSGGRVERSRDNEELRDDAPAAADDARSLDADVVGVDARSPRSTLGPRFPLRGTA